MFLKHRAVAAFTVFGLFRQFIVQQCSICQTHATSADKKTCLLFRNVCFPCALACIVGLCAATVVVVVEDRKHCVRTGERRKKRSHTNDQRCRTQARTLSQLRVDNVPGKKFHKSSRLPPTPHSADKSLGPPPVPIRAGGAVDNVLTVYRTARF